MKREDGTGGFSLGYKKLTINGRRILEHRYIVEKSIGRKLKPNEIIHHLDGNKLNNSLNNLIITNQNNHITTFHNNRPKIFDWNNFDPKISRGICPICNKHAAKKTGLCRKHYGTYWHWKQKH